MTRQVAPGSNEASSIGVNQDSGHERLGNSESQDNSNKCELGPNMAHCKLDLNISEETKFESNNVKSHSPHQCKCSTRENNTRLEQKRSDQNRWWRTQNSLKPVAAKTPLERFFSLLLPLVLVLVLPAISRLPLRGQNKLVGNGQLDPNMPSETRNLFDTTGKLLLTLVNQSDDIKIQWACGPIMMAEATSSSPIAIQQQQQQAAAAASQQLQQLHQQHHHQQQQQQANAAAIASGATLSTPKNPKSNHRLVNKIKDARHRRRHRHQRRRRNQLAAATAAAAAANASEQRQPMVVPSASQAAAFAAMAAAAAEPAVQAASSTALTALESIVEEVARAGVQIPLAAANAMQHHYKQQQLQLQQQQQQQPQSQPQQQQPQPQQQQPHHSEAPTSVQPQSSAAVSGANLLLEGSSSSTSSIQVSAQQQQQQPAQMKSAPTPAPSQLQSQPPSAPTLPAVAASTQNQQHLPAPATSATRAPIHNTRGFLLTTTLSKIYNLLNVTEFALEMRDGISSRASCVACNAVVGLFLSPLYSKEVFSAAIRTVCISFRIQSSRVCMGLVESFQDDFEYIRKNTKLTRDEVCGVVFGVDCARRQTYNLFWTVPIPELPPASIQTSKNNNNQQQQPQRVNSALSKPPSSTSTSSLSLPLDEHSLTSLDDAPDLFEYQKSAASSASPTTISVSSSSSKQEENKQIGSLMSLAAQQKQQQSAADKTDCSDQNKATSCGGVLPAASSSSSSSSSSNGQITATTKQEIGSLLEQQHQQAKLMSQAAAARKASKMLKRPQYIFDDDQYPANGQVDQQQQQRSSFVHLTDIHIDPYYEAGSLNECNEPLCCRATSGPVPVNDKRRQAGRWGDYGNCDVPVRTLRNALNRIREMHSDAEYWLWTGDISPHDIWNITKAEAANHVRLVTKLVRTYSNGLPVFPVIGNHEAHPVNSFSPPEIKGKFSMSWLYDLLADEWSDWLPEEALKTLRVGGYYKLHVRKGFRILALNTNYCARLNPWSFYDPVDPANQLKWLAEELLEAELNQDKVHIIGHVPPDNRECTQAWLFNFINIVDRFRDTIMAQFYGHTHRDEWRVIYSLARPDDPIGVQFIGPSITPFTENNPSYRIYHQNKQALVLDSETYYFNLTEANETPLSEPKWRFSYSTRAHLNMTYGMGPVQWHQYLQKLHEDDDQFDNFYKNYYRYSDVKLGQVCRNKCRYQLLSDLVLMHPYKTKPKPFLANRKTSNHHRDRHDHHHHHHRRLRSHQE